MREEIAAENFVCLLMQQEFGLMMFVLLVEAFRRLNLDPDRLPQAQTNGDREKMEVETLGPDLMEVSISTELVSCKIIKTIFEWLFLKLHL